MQYLLGNNPDTFGLKVDIGFVVGDDVSPSADDASVKTFLESQGHTVTYIDDSNGTGSETHDVIIISGSVSSANVSNTYKDFVGGVTTMDYDLLDDMLFTSSWGTDSGVDSIIVQSSTHPIVTHTGISGTTKIFTPTTSNVTRYSFLSNAGPDAVNVVSTVDDSNRAAIYTYDVGDTLEDNSTTAAGRRAGVFLLIGEFTDLNETGESLFNAIILWLGSKI